MAGSRFESSRWAQQSISTRCPFLAAKRKKSARSAVAWPLIVDSSGTSLAVAGEAPGLAAIDLVEIADHESPRIGDAIFADRPDFIDSGGDRGGNRHGELPRERVRAFVEGVVGSRLLPGRNAGLREEQRRRVVDVRAGERDVERRARLAARRKHADQLGCGQLGAAHAGRQ